MANEVNFGWATEKELTFSVYTAAGVQREAGTEMTETPASSGLYLGTPTTIQTGDNVVVKEGTIVRGHGEYGGGIEGDFEIVIPAGYVGDYLQSETVYFFWHTNMALDTNGTVVCYKDNNTGEVTIPTGITDTRDFDSKTGVHLVKIDLTANSFYVPLSDYAINLNGAVVGSKTLNVTLATFSIENRHQGLKWLKNG